MNEFTYPLTLVQFLIPTFGTGILLGGIVLYGYMAIRYKSGLYVIMSLMALFAIGFVGSESMILGLGAFLHNWELSIHFHQLEHLSGAFFLFGLPWFLLYVLQLGDKWRNVNRIIAFAGLGYAVLCVIVTFVSPDLFISSTIHKKTWLLNEADYGRGQEGILYVGRDGLLGLYIIYSMISIFADLRRNKNYKYLLFPVVGILFALAGAGIDIGFVYTNVNFDMFPHEYFSRFSLGVTLFILCLLSGLTSRFIDVAKEVERAHQLITISEEKYRVLVEGTNDLIFTIDPDGRFYSANRAALRATGLNEERIKEVSFIDVLHVDNETNEVEKQVFRERLAELNEKKDPLNTKIMLKGIMGEPKEYQIRMEYINIEGRNEIIVRAVSITENALVKYLDSESQKYIIGNYFIAAEEISKRLVANLAKYLDSPQVMHIRVGLREIIINAIEHGNLNLTFDEKSEATMNDSYMEVIAERRNHPEYRDKKVTIKFSLSPDRVIYVIEDEGNGFDYSKILNRVNDEVNKEELAHGRGITMALSIFDTVKYNELGNKVTLVRRFTPGNTETVEI